MDRPERNHDDDYRRRLVVSAALSVPVVVVSMVAAWQFPGWQWFALALATPVVTWGAWPFHRAAVVNLRHGATTMDTLVSIGVLASYLWSAQQVVAGDMHHQLYLEVASVVTTFILAGQRLVTVRYAEPRAFPIFVARCNRTETDLKSGPAVLIGLLETIIDRLADFIERLRHITARCGLPIPPRPEITRETALRLQNFHSCWQSRLREFLPLGRFRRTRTKESRSDRLQELPARVWDRQAHSRVYNRSRDGGNTGEQYHQARRGTKVLSTHAYR